MAPTIPSSPPAVFRAGDTVKFTASPSEYPVGDGWTVTYTVNGVKKQSATASESGGKYLVTISATNSALLDAGTYLWTLTASKGGETYTIAHGSLTVLPNVSAAAAGALQSQDEKELAYLNAEIEARAQSDHTEYTVNGRSLKRESIVDLMEWRDKLRARIARQRRGGALATVAVQFPSGGAGRPG